MIEQIRNSQIKNEFIKYTSGGRVRVNVHKALQDKIIQQKMKDLKENIKRKAEL